MKFLLVCSAILTLANAASIIETANSPEKIRYDNYSVYKILIKDERQLSVIKLISELSDKYNLWKSPRGVGSDVHIMVKPEVAKYFTNIVKMFGLKTEVLIPNVQKLIDDEQAVTSAADGSFGWNRYHSLDEIEAWLDKILAQYPNVTEGFTIGKSYEGRPIRGIKISFKPGNPGIFIESNIHARKWITSATVTYFINELLSSKNATIRDLAENINWYIIPVFNVDGFVYSHKKDRLWRKTRQPVKFSSCIGTDANRNFDSHWLENGGASSNPCDETFAGTAPFSEPETKALAEYIASIKNEISIYLSFHSYSQLLLSPYGHNATEFPTNYGDILKIAQAAANAIESLSYRTHYGYGSTASVLYIATGSSVDWACNTYGFKVGYTFEFRDKGRYGFVLPPVQIIPNCEEAMAAMVALVRESRKLKYL